MKKPVRLYNVLFPVWRLWLVPQVWLVVLPGNFLIDSLVLFLAMKGLALSDKKRRYGESIWKVFLFGLLADFIAAGVLMFLAFVMEWGGPYADDLYLTVPALFLAGGMIFIFNYYITFRKSEQFVRWRLSLALAVFTAPYTFLIPSRWIYHF